MNFLAANIRKPNTRRAYTRVAGDFFHWCQGHDVRDLVAVAPIHVAGWIEQLGGTLSAPTVKLRLAAIRNLFD
ncbi:MAG TPA: site-specific integrase [Sphingobium sp.]|uniref:site-specific integrase n=1 Tax=Sphingobium sp. TaxID=1912891 RepID=UPI002ED3E0FB